MINLQKFHKLNSYMEIVNFKKKTTNKNEIKIRLCNKVSRFLKFKHGHAWSVFYIL